MRISITVILAAAVAACSTPPQTAEPVVGPCDQLSAYCDACTQAGPKEQCEQAVMDAVDAECEAVLDNPGVRAACILPDAAADAVADARSPAACGEAGVPDAGCACNADAGAACSPSCPHGGCSFVCEPGATCAASCAGGGCIFDCKPGSHCMNSCTGGRCSFECEVGAVCSDSCSPMPNTCVGP